MNKKFKLLLSSLSIAAIGTSTVLLVSSCGSDDDKTPVTKTEQEIWLEPFIKNVQGNNKEKDREMILSYIKEAKLEYKETDFTDPQAKEVGKGVVLYNNYTNNDGAIDEKDTYRNLYFTVKDLVKDMFPEKNGDTTQQSAIIKKLRLSMMVFESFYTTSENKTLSEPKDIDQMLPGIWNILNSFLPLGNLVQQPDFSKEDWATNLYTSIKALITDEKTKNLVKNGATIVSYLTQLGSKYNTKDFKTAVNEIIGSFDLEDDIKKTIEGAIPGVLDKILIGSLSKLTGIKDIINISSSLINLAPNLLKVEWAKKLLTFVVDLDNVNKLITELNSIINKKMESMGYSFAEGKTWDGLLMARIGQVADKVIESINEQETKNKTDSKNNN